MRTRWLLPILTSSLLAARLWAAAPPTAETDALRDLVTQYEQAIRSGDVSKSGIRKTLATGFTSVLPSGQLIVSYGDLSKAENALRTMVGRGTHYDLAEVVVDPSIEVRGDLAAYTGQTLNQATAQAGRSLAFTTHWSAVAKKEDGAWRLLRHQAVMDPATNPWHREDSNGPGWGLVAAAGLLGVLAGTVLGVAAVRVTRGRGRGSSTGREPSHPPGARTRAGAKDSPGSQPTSASAPGRSWSAGPAPEPADPPTSLGPPDPDHAAPTPPPPSRSDRKRPWEA